MKNYKVVVLYGGVSSEHDISLLSAAYVFKHLSENSYNIQAVWVSPDGNWYPQILGEVLAGLPPKPSHASGFEMKDRHPRSILRSLCGIGAQEKVVFFPVMHGKFGEGGDLQGFLELSGESYVGPDAAASSLCMDKYFSKCLASNLGIPVLPANLYYRGEVVRENLGWPVFVKPCNTGSSIGISKAENSAELAASVDLAFRHEDRIIVEQGLDRGAREIECAFMGSVDEIGLAGPGEIVTNGSGFYDFKAKYTEGGARLDVPAMLSEPVRDQILRYCKVLVRGFNLHGLARLDFFLTESGIYFNEINTVPGLTEYSQFPKQWERSMPPASILDRLLSLAEARPRSLL